MIPPMPLTVDLHSHTTCSDGRVAPRDLIRLAKEQGVHVLAVTDHDSVEALPECLDEGRIQGVRVIPGIEMSSRFEGHDVHVLGLGLDHQAPTLLKKLGELQASRRARVGLICEKLKALGVGLEPAEVLAEAGGKSVGRKHVARAMVKKGLVGSIDEAFNKYLGQGSPANVAATSVERATYPRGSPTRASWRTPRPWSGSSTAPRSGPSRSTTGTGRRPGTSDSWRLRADGT